jgi:Sodium Bile acid symporter family
MYLKVCLFSCIYLTLQCVHAFKYATPQRSFIRATATTTSMSSLSSGIAMSSRNMNLRMMSDAASSPAIIVASSTAKPVSSLWTTYVKVMDVLTTLFPLWTVIFASLALKRPASFDWFTTQYFTASLGALMLSMGITLTVDDFKRVAREPNYPIVGFLLCYVLMPALGLALGKAFKLPVDFVAGLILIGSINGGQASNLCTYIARGDVALSGNNNIFPPPLLFNYLVVVFSVDDNRDHYRWNVYDSFTMQAYPRNYRTSRRRRYRHVVSTLSLHLHHSIYHKINCPVDVYRLFSLLLSAEWPSINSSQSSLRQYYQSHPL